MTPGKSSKPEDSDSIGYLECVPRAKADGEATVQIVMPEPGSTWVDSLVKVCGVEESESSELQL